MISVNRDSLGVCRGERGWGREKVKERKLKKRIIKRNAKGEEWKRGETDAQNQNRNKTTNDRESEE